MPDAQPGKLDGWKAIAGYLGRDERTVQRWRKERAMPVYQVPGGKGGSVFAYAGEVDTWLRNHLPAHERDPQSGQAAATESSHAAHSSSGSYPDPRDEPGPAVARAGSLPSSLRSGARLTSLLPSTPARALALTTLLVIGGALLLVIGGALLTALAWMRSPGRPDRVEFAEDAFIAWRGAQVVWRREILPPAETPVSRPAVPFAGARGIRLLDINGDRDPEILAPIRFTSEQFDQVARSDEFYCLSAGGSLLWTHNLERKLEFSARRFSGPWLIRDWIVVPGHGTSQIWAASIHHTWWPSFLVSLEPTGSPALRFVNAGHIYSIAYVPAAAKSYILAAGVNNEYAAAALAVLPANAAPATSPGEPQSPYTCLSCPEGRPDRYVLFPRSELARVMGVPYNMAYSVQVTDGGIEISVREVAEPQLRSIYRLSRDLDVQSIALSDAYWETHRRFEREGRLNHRVGQCDEWREGKELRVWTSETGWKTTWARPAFGDGRTE